MWSYHACEGKSSQMYYEELGGTVWMGARIKGGIKALPMMDAFSEVAEFARMTAAETYDRIFLYHVNPVKNSWIVFDNTYIAYRQFEKWTQKGIWLVSRIKDNAKSHLTRY